MKSPWKKLLIAAGLTAFVLAVALLATHFLFPYRIAAQTARNQIEASSPLMLSFEGPQPGWPFYYSLDSVHISAAASSGTITLVHFDEVELHVAPLGLLTGCLGVSFRAKAGPGLVRGRAESRMGRLDEYHINIEEIDLPDFAISLPGRAGGVRGRLTGQITIMSQGKASPMGGRGSIRLGPGRIDGLDLPLVPLSTLKIDRLALNFKLEPSRVIVEKLEAEGPLGRLGLTGRVMDFKKPRLNLTGTAQLGSSGKVLTTINFRLTGPAAQPRVKVVSMKGPGGLSVQDLIKRLER